VAKKRNSLSAVVSLMSEDNQNQLQEQQTTVPSSVIALEKILPDFDQPRRLLPDDIVEQVVSGDISSAEALHLWLHRAKSEPALRKDIQKLRRLANSIEQHSLINPISVRTPRPDEPLPAGIEYLIVTGERRYWTHQLLASEDRQIYEGTEPVSPEHIKVTFAAEGITVRAHQLIENSLREDINAVERAQGVVALRYELSGIREYSDKGVNDSSPSLVPWSRVEEALGISKRYRIYIVAVLNNLTPEAQKIVNEHNLTESTIRPIVQKLKDRPDLQTKALEQLVARMTGDLEDEEESAGPGFSVDELVNRLLAGQERSTRRVSSAPITRFGTDVRKTLDFLDRLKEEDRTEFFEALGRDEFAEIRLDLRNLRGKIDEILGDTPVA
jgi:hypothetical protein